MRDAKGQVFCHMIALNDGGGGGVNHNLSPPKKRELQPVVLGLMSLTHK